MPIARSHNSLDVKLLQLVLLSLILWEAAQGQLIDFQPNDLTTFENSFCCKQKWLAVRVYSPVTVVISSVTLPIFNPNSGTVVTVLVSYTLAQDGRKSPNPNPSKNTHNYSDSIYYHTNSRVHAVELSHVERI